ncbi:hypothetical protein JKG47_12940 [Acidithiobacillus sp. MC6.1]|nr:hypothetical protein [Acidithiobacillus sp. MC6.1]
MNQLFNHPRRAEARTILLQECLIVMGLLLAAVAILSGLAFFPGWATHAIWGWDGFLIGIGGGLGGGLVLMIRRGLHREYLRIVRALEQHETGRFW